MAVRVQGGDFDVSAELSKLTAGDFLIGGAAIFVGKMREQSESRLLAAMTLEHYPGMTEAELERIDAEARHRFNLSASLIVHRIGTLKPGDNIVLVIAGAPHRQDAFDAVQFLMDFLKTRAPFWKKELFADGSARWVEARDSDVTAAGGWQKGSK